MSKLLGFGLIVSGVVIGGLAVPLGASSPGGGEIRIASAVVGAGEGAADVPRQAEGRSFSTPALKPLASPALQEPQRAERSQPTPPPAAPAARKPIVTPFETVTVPSDPAAITRAVQAELTRVGCYHGPVTGHWGPETRRAMKAFTTRVNAALPVDKPDVILLSLVRAEASVVCGGACPAGQDATADGQCVPKAVLAQAARKARPALAKAPAVVAHDAASDARRVTPAPAAPTQPPAINEDQPRMALAGPKVEDQPATAVAATPVEKPAQEKHVKKRERKEPAVAARYGQTKWAREFFRNNATF